MVYYDLRHLDQPSHQAVLGPIQDDEALFLYSIIRGSRLKYILEIGGLLGYSARNFLAAIQPVNGSVYTVDINYVKPVGENHITINKNALYLTPSDVDGKQMDMVFFDCHDMIQIDIFHHFVKEGVISDSTILALHDTNLHYKFEGFDPTKLKKNETYVASEGGYVHQHVEREMVNIFKSLGYDCFCLHTDQSKHNMSLPFRHGITICKKFKPLINS